MPSGCRESNRAWQRSLADALVGALLCAAALAASAAAAVEKTAQPLRVCADPEQRGPEVRMARLLADALDRPLQIAWQPQHRGTVRKTLNAGLCDLLPGVPAGWPAVLATTPYYRAS